MTLELDGLGKLFIRNVTPEAMSYLRRARQAEGNPFMWHFAKEPCARDLRVYYNHNNFDNPWLMHYLDVLIEEYGLTCSMAVGLLLNSWREICKRVSDFAAVKKEKIALEEQLRRMKARIERGCAGCSNFREARDGDDILGYCIMGEKQVLLEDSPLCMKYGGFGTDRLWHYGQKYYPHDGCKYLEIEGEKV